MHRYRSWGLSAALAFGPTAAAVAADPTPGPKPLLGRLFGSDERPPAANPADPPGRPQLPTAPLSPDAVASALRAEQEAYLRRLEVCTKLRQVAAESADESLIQQADTLEQQATTLYHARVARFGVRSVRPAAVARTAPAPAPSPGPVPADVLDRELGSGVAVTPLDSPPAADDESGRPATASTQAFRRAPQP